MASFGHTNPWLRLEQGGRGEELTDSEKLPAGQPVLVAQCPSSVEAVGAGSQATQGNGVVTVRL